MAAGAALAAGLEAAATVAGSDAEASDAKAVFALAAWLDEKEGGDGTAVAGTEGSVPG
jgi:hypothetical protein